eukprot:PhF_6_TR4924/c0_g1_i1/m.6980
MNPIEIIDALQGKSAEQEEAIHLLTHEIQKTQSIIQTTPLQQIQQAEAKAKEHLESFHRKMVHVNVDVKALVAEVHQLEAAVETRNNHSKYLNAVCEQYKQYIDELRLVRTKSSHDVDQATHDVAVLRKQVEEARRNYKPKTRGGSLRSDCDESAGEQAYLLQLIQDHEHRISKLKKEIETVERRATDTKGLLWGELTKNNNTNKASAPPRDSAKTVLLMQLRDETEKLRDENVVLGTVVIRLETMKKQQEQR